MIRYTVTIGKSTGSAGEKVNATAIIMSVIGRRDDRSKFRPVCFSAGRVRVVPTL